MVQRSDVEFPSHGVTCRAWLYKPIRATVAAADRAGPSAELKIYPGVGHFDIYTGAGFERSSADQGTFFERALRGPATDATD